MYLEKPYDICDPYGNPQIQELVQILPHAEWAVHGHPANKVDGRIGNPRTWELDVGSLSSRLYFYQVSFFFFPCIYEGHPELYESNIWFQVTP